MLTVPSEIIEKLKADSVPKTVKIHFPNGERADITNANIEQESLVFTERTHSDEFKLGMCEKRVLEFMTVGIENIKGYKIQAFLSIDGIDIPLGVFVVDECKRQMDLSKRKVVAYEIDHFAELNETPHRLLADTKIFQNLIFKAATYVRDAQLPFSETPETLWTSNLDDYKFRVMRSGVSHSTDRIYFYHNGASFQNFHIEVHCIRASQYYCDGRNLFHITPNKIKTEHRQLMENTLLEFCQRNAVPEDTTAEALEFVKSVQNGYIWHSDFDSWGQASEFMPECDNFYYYFSNNNGNSETGAICETKGITLTYSDSGITTDYEEVFQSYPEKDPVSPYRCDWDSQYPNYDGLTVKQFDNETDSFGRIYEQVFFDKETAEKYISGWCELYGMICRSDRDGVFKAFKIPGFQNLFPADYIFPDNNLYPMAHNEVPSASLSPSEIASIWYDEKYNPQYKEIQWEEDSRLYPNYETGIPGATAIYDLADNPLSGFVGRSGGGIWTLSALIDTLSKIKYITSEIDTIGRPDIEAGDMIHFGEYDTLVLTRTLKGIWSLQDNYEAE